MERKRLGEIERLSEKEPDDRGHFRERLNKMKVIQEKGQERMLNNMSQEQQCAQSRYQAQGWPG